MKVFIKNLFNAIWSRIKKLFHIGKETVEDIAEDAKDIICAQLKEELELINKEIETATGEALERLQARAALIHS